MKYIFIFTVSFFLVSPFVFAARTVPGNIPQLTPLQPIPEGAGIDRSQNINFKGPDGDLGDFEQVSTTTNSSPNTPYTHNNKTRSFWLFWLNDNQAAEQVETGFLKNIIFLIFVVAVLAGGVYYFKRNK